MTSAIILDHAARFAGLGERASRSIRGSEAATNGQGESMRLSEVTVDAMSTCALRFDGWAFVEHRGDDGILQALSDRFVATFQMSVDPNENHAAFFALQRFLFKWGGEPLPESSREHAAFGFLFLHLYRLDVEPALRAREYWERWQVEHAGRADVYAAEVRERLLRDHRDD